MKASAWLFHIMKPGGDSSALNWFYWLLWLLPLIFFPLQYEPYESAKYFWLVGGSGLLVLLWMREKTPRPAFFHPAIRILSAWLLWAGFSSFLGIYWRGSVFGAYTRYNHSLILYAAVIIIVLYGFSRMDALDFSRLAKGWVAGGVIVALSGIAQAFGFLTDAVPVAGGMIRPIGLLGNSNVSALFVGAVLPYVFIALMDSPARKLRWLYTAAACIMAWGFILFDSRSALVGLGAGGVAMAYGLFRLRKLRWVAGFLLAAFVLAAVIFSLNGRFKISGILRSPTSSEFNVQSRMFVWAATGDMVRQSPWAGYGVGTFDFVYGQFKQSNMVGERYVFDDPHNVYLAMLFFGGWPLALLFLFFCVATAVFFLFRMHSGPTETWRVGAFASFLVVAAASVFNPFPVVGYCLLFAPAWVIWPTVQDRFRLRAGFLRPLVWCFAASLCAFGLVSFVAECMFYRGLSTYEARRGDQGLSSLRVARRLAPWVDIYAVYYMGAQIRAGRPAVLVSAEAERFSAQLPLRARVETMAGDVYTALAKRDGGGNFQKQAIRHYMLSAALERNTPERQSRLAHEYYRTGNYPAAKRYVQQAIAVRPANFSSLLLLARLYQLEGDAPLTLKYVRIALQLDPANKNLRRLFERMQSSPAETLNTPISLQVPRTTLE